MPGPEAPSANRATKVTRVSTSVGDMDPAKVGTDGATALSAANPLAPAPAAAEPGLVSRAGDLRTPDRDGERTIGQLVSDASREVSSIVRAEIALAKAEVTGGLKIGGKGAGLLAGAAFLGLLGLIFLFHTLAWVLDVWLPIWAGYLIVTLLLLIGAGVLGLLGKKALSQAKPKPEIAIDEAHKTVEAVKQSA